jgi:hypothetical protein
MPVEIGGGEPWLSEPKPWTLEARSGTASVVR